MGGAPSPVLHLSCKAFTYTVYCIYILQHYRPAALGVPPHQLIRYRGPINKKPNQLESSQSKRFIFLWGRTIQNNKAIMFRKPCCNFCLTPYSLVVGFFVVCRDKNPYLIKGSVSRDFRPLFLSNDSNPSGPLMNRVNYFRIRFRFRRDILSQSSTNSTLRCALQILGLVKPLFKTSNLFFHDRCVHP